MIKKIFLPLALLATAQTVMAQADPELDEVKAHADYITSSVDEDGITNALKHFEII